MNEEINNIVTNEIVEINDSSSNTVYGVANNIYTIVSTLTFIIVVIFVYKYLKVAFRKR